MSETYPCSGGCGLVLDKPEAWCLLCVPRSDPKPTTPTRESEPMTEHQIRMQIWHQAYKLALGTKAEQAEALEHIAQLVAQLRGMK